MSREYQPTLQHVGVIAQYSKNVERVTVRASEPFRKHFGESRIFIGLTNWQTCRRILLLKIKQKLLGFHATGETS